MGENNTNGRKSQTVIIEKEVVEPETLNAATTETPTEASQQVKETPNKPKKPIKLILAWNLMIVFTLLDWLYC